MPHCTLLYIHVKQGTELKPGSLVGTHGHRADYVTLANGDAVGVFRAQGAMARLILEAEPGITVLPPLHRPIQAVHAAAFAHVNAVVSELGFDIVDRLLAFHRMPWLDPESLDL